MDETDLYLGMYRDREESAIPWALMAPREQLVEWLDETAPAPGRALVVACGFGDDAAELARRDWTVSAFDVSPIAVERCRERFADLDVDFSVQDLFALPPDWTAAFDLVVDVFTVQAMSPSRRTEVVAAVSGPAAPGGRIFVHTVSRDDDQVVDDGPPWPLSAAELALFGEYGSLEYSRETDRDPASNLWRTTAVYRVASP